jgi:hypothetical protein
MIRREFERHGSSSNDWMQWMHLNALHC